MGARLLSCLLDLSSACCCSCCSKSAPTLVEYLILRCIVYSRPHDFQSISFNQSIEKQVKESQNAILNNPHPRGRRCSCVRPEPIYLHISHQHYCWYTIQHHMGSFDWNPSTSLTNGAGYAFQIIDDGNT